ncbi:MAG: hypothetical protein K1Y02_07115 [Candidatus Hydrogenedentes bacterium]|nr:hypothetical protein [Candidatus Hydrogenedentota bacterium]
MSLPRIASLVAIGFALSTCALGSEFDDLQADIARHTNGLTDSARLAREALEPSALILDTDRDPLDIVLRRTQALLDDLLVMPKHPDLANESDTLSALRKKSQSVLPGDPARRVLFDEACALRRGIAFSNPLLDFSDVLFLKHDRATYQHMVDQYFGFRAVPGGGVFVLQNAFAESPSVRNVLADSVVESGRLKGQSLDKGSFISLELSYDARRVLFAWTQAAVPVEPTDLTPHKDLWTPESTYHIFAANLDGTGLTQLTDGAWNDFDPCFLPNGRICFISERRGGFLRCGVRPDPTYTLHSMRADGSDIIPLSYHETHEWHPSVNNDGMIVYSRWDYVDRDSDIAHHLWLTFPDGRDPRSFHGNYPAVRESRPWMELSIRAVPNAHTYVATSTPHHGQNYGSLVLIDMRGPDDRSMSQIRRITPEVALPEAETAPGVPGKLHGGKNTANAEVYGTAWPLSEKYYLCVYDLGQKNYGLYLLDAFGNRELLYRDPAMACLDPIPLRPRPLPPVIPTRTRQAIEDREDPVGSGHFADLESTGRVAIMNIYESELPWPEGTKISALRIIQLFPKTTPAANEPKIGFGEQSLARGVLGTVPVEADGSVFCEVPAGVPFYFQALDEEGRAVQTMRSDTYVHPGETLSCVGCHEPKKQAPRNPTPLAMQKAPASLIPPPDGAYPLLFSRLVQPVLDRQCTECHAKYEKAPKLDGKTFGEFGWSTAYHEIAPFGWAKHGGNGALAKNETSYSIPGKVGARASKLLEILKDDAHKEAKFTKDDLARLTLWLDCNSVFYGDYLETEKQARGESVMPKIF